MYHERIVRFIHDSLGFKCANIQRFTAITSYTTSPLYNISNYNRANDVAGGVALWQPIPRTADVTVNKMAGVRVRILMNR